MTCVMRTNVKTPRDATCKSNLQVRPDAVRWVGRLDAFLGLNERQVLVGAGKVSHKQAVAHAQGEYEQFSALEAEGEGYAVRLLGSGAADESARTELGNVATRLAKKSGGRNAA